MIKKIKLLGINHPACCFTADKDKFRKIRPGFIQERSPMKTRDLRLRKNLTISKSKKKINTIM